MLRSALHRQRGPDAVESRGTAVAPPSSSMEPTNLCGVLRRAMNGDNGLVVVGPDDGEQRFTYREIFQRACRRAEALRRLGVRRGDAVIVVLDTSFELVEVLFGVMLAGGAVAPAYPPVAMTRIQDYVRLLDHVVSATGARFVVTDRAIADAIGPRGDVVDVATLDAEPTRSFVDPSPDDVGLIQCTSGSTALPKPAVLLQRNLVANCRALAAVSGVGARDTSVSWLPLYHDFGLIGILYQGLYGGCEQVVMSPARFLTEPAAWWRAVSRHRATITSAPSFAFGLSAQRLTAEDVAALDLTSVRMIVSGGEPIQPRVIERFYDVLAPAGLDRGSFSSAYGLAEACVGVTLTAPGEGLRTVRVCRDALACSRTPRAIVSDEGIDCVAVGRPLPGMGVTIRGRHGEALDRGYVGEVTVVGPSLMAGYLGHPEATAAALHDGELCTGDLGFLDDEGRLYIIGRSKHVLIVRGRNYYAEDIEAAVEELPGVRKGNAYALTVYDDRRGTDTLTIAVETRVAEEPARRALENAIAETVFRRVGISPQRVVLARPWTLPKTSSGKKQRLRCRELVAAEAS